jgi:hypothetical protein
VEDALHLTSSFEQVFLVPGDGRNARVLRRAGIASSSCLVVVHAAGTHMRYISEYVEHRVMRQTGVAIYIKMLYLEIYIRVYIYVGGLALSATV